MSERWAQRQTDELFARIRRQVGEQPTSLPTAWRFVDIQLLDCVHSWSIFTMYWPAIAFYALIGRE